MKNQVWAIVAALVVALAPQVGSWAAATGTSGAITRDALQGKVRIHLARCRRLSAGSSEGRSGLLQGYHQALFYAWLRS